MREAAGLGVREWRYNPVKFVKFEMQNVAFWRLLDSKNGFREVLISK